MRFWNRISVRTRAAIGAALAAVLAFGLATLWVGQAAYDQWLPNAQAVALRDATALDESTTDPQALRGYQQSAFVMVLADGSWAQPARNRAAGGAGLGLALVRSLTRSLGGTAAAVEPEPGRGGARLVVRLPMAEPGPGE